MKKRYYTEPSAEAIRAECGNPDLVELFWVEVLDTAGNEGAQAHWLCECDSSDAPTIIAALELRDALLQNFDLVEL